MGLRRASGPEYQRLIVRGQTLASIATSATVIRGWFVVGELPVESALIVAEVRSGQGSANRVFFISVVHM